MLTLDRKTNDRVHNLITYIRNCLNQGTCTRCNFADTITGPYCDALCEIGIIFLTDAEIAQRETAEEFLTLALKGAEFSPSLKLVAFCFLKRQKAFTCDKTENLIEMFESDPQNMRIVQEAEKFLA